MHIYAYNEHSRGAKALAQKLGIKRIKHQGSRFRGGPNKTVINWGSSELPPELMQCQILNFPEEVARVSNKLQFFAGIPADTYNWTPPWTQDIEAARRWLRDGHAVMCRTVLNGHSGNGIVYSRTEDELVNAPLYVMYKKKREEYRVHVHSAQVIDIQRKARRLDVPDDQVNWQIRNHHNGFIFQRNEVVVPESVRVAALEAMAQTTLDFGAVDIIMNEHENQPYVLEINTAPGLEGTTIDNYANAFRIP